MTTPGFLFQSEALLLATPTDQLVDTNAALLDKALAFVDDGDSNIRYVYRRAATTGGLTPTGSPADGRWFRTGPELLLDVALSANVTPADQAPIPFDAGGSLIPSEWNGTAWTASQDYGLCDVTLNLRAGGSNRVVADTRLNGVSINTIDIGATGGSAPSAAISKKVQISSGDVVSTRTFGFALRGDAGLSMSFMQVTKLS
jgi:hypothetical protein